MGRDRGTPDFFFVTKRIRNRPNGVAGDGGPLDDRAWGSYEGVLAGNTAELVARVLSGDVVIVHDPKPAGLIGAMRKAGTTVIWRCHLGIDRPNDLAREAWRFLLPYVSGADAFVFSRESFVREGVDRDRIVVIPPSIDVFSPKNVDLDPDTVVGVLRANGVLSNGAGSGKAVFRRQDGTPGRVDRRAELFGTGAVSAQNPHRAPGLSLGYAQGPNQCDPRLRGFCAPSTGAHLVYAGPAVSAVADDPEGMRVLGESSRAVGGSAGATQEPRASRLAADG